MARRSRARLSKRETQVPGLRSASCPAEEGSTGYRTCLPVSMNCGSVLWATRLSCVLGVNLTADQSVSFEFVLQKGNVHWTDLSLYQADQLLPAGKGKGALFTPQPGQPTATCAACHGIQTRIASTVRDEAGWRDRVEYMRTTMRVRINDQEAAEIASYLNTLFGEDSKLPKSPADVPGYEKVVQSFGDDAMNIVYVEYEVWRRSFPGVRFPDKKGNGMDTL